MMTTRSQVCETSGRMCVLRMIVWLPASSRMSCAGFDDLLGIETRRRLVEDQHFRIVNDRLREADALPVAFRELPAVTVRHVVDAGLFITSSTRAALRSLEATTLSFATNVQVFPHRHFRVERRRFRQVAGAALGFDRLIEHVVTGDDGLALGGRHVAGQDAHRRGLAGAVRAEEAENFASLDLEFTSSTAVTRP